MGIKELDKTKEYYLGNLNEEQRGILYDYLLSIDDTFKQVKKYGFQKRDDDYLIWSDGYIKQWDWNHTKVSKNDTDALELFEEPKPSEVNIINPTPIFGITEDKIVQAVMNDLNERSKVGLAKYNTSLERTDLNLKDWLIHAYEETLDKANYLKRAILEIENNA